MNLRPLDSSPSPLQPDRGPRVQDAAGLPGMLKRLELIPVPGHHVSPVASGLIAVVMVHVQEALPGAPR